MRSDSNKKHPAKEKNLTCGGYKDSSLEAAQRAGAKVHPKIAQVDLDATLDPSFVRNLEARGFLAGQRKKVT